MKRIILLVLNTAIFSMIFVPLTAQTDQNSRINYDVHREYDSQGNLIYYDSALVVQSNNDFIRNEKDSIIRVWHAPNDSSYSLDAQISNESIYLPYPIDKEMNISPVREFFHTLESSLNLPAIESSPEFENFLQQIQHISRDCQYEIEERFEIMEDQVIDWYNQNESNKDIMIRDSTKFNTESKEQSFSGSKTNI